MRGEEGDHTGEIRNLERGTTDTSLLHKQGKAAPINLRTGRVSQMEDSFKGWESSEIKDWESL